MMLPKRGPEESAIII